MTINIHGISTTVDISMSTLIKDIRTAMNEDVELQMLKNHIIRWWLHTKDEVEPGVERY